MSRFNFWLGACFSSYTNRDRFDFCSTTTDDDDDDNDSAGDDTAAATVDADSYLDEALALERHRLEHSFGTASLQQRLGSGQRRADRPAARPRRANEQMYVYRGIADECCMRPCSVRTLLSYCRTPPKY